MLLEGFSKFFEGDRGMNSAQFRLLKNVLLGGFEFFDPKKTCFQIFFFTFGLIDFVIAPKIGLLAYIGGFFYKKY